MPKGILVAVGGAEDKRDDMLVLRRVLDEVRGQAERVEVVAAASREPRQAAEPYLRAFAEMGIRKVDWLAIEDRKEADDPRTSERLAQADVIYLTGGDQARLAGTLRGSQALEAIRRRYEEGAVVAGTSAGAAAMSPTMLARGKVEEGLSKGNVRTEPGLGLMPGTVIDTHFVQRGRFARLLEVVAHDPALTGIGISEDTAIVVRGGHNLEVVGSDNVIIFDGAEVLHSNADEAGRGDNIVVARAIVHALAAGCHYDLVSREIQVPKVQKVALRQPEPSPEAEAHRARRPERGERPRAAGSERGPGLDRPAARS